MPYMDPFVFGTSYFYVLMVILTVYLFLFAAPSSAKLTEFPILSYGLQMVDVSMVLFLVKLLIKGATRSRIHSLVYLLNRLNDPVTPIILLVLVLREKMLLCVCCRVDI